MKVRKNKDKDDEKSNGSLGFHLLQPDAQLSKEPTSVNDLLGSYPIDHPIWGKDGDSVSFDFSGRIEALAGMYASFGGDKDDNVYEGYLDASSGELNSSTSDKQVSDYLCMFQNDGDEDNFYLDGSVDSEDEDDLYEDDELWFQE